MSNATMPIGGSDNAAVTAIEVDGEGKLNYRGASETGFIEAEIPSLPGSPRETETLHARDLALHIVNKVESSMSAQPYLTTGPVQSPSQTFAHYAGVLQGAGLVDSRTSKQLARLVNDFSGTPKAEQRKYFDETIKPFLGSLTPARRK